MYIRMTFFKLKPGNRDAARAIYNKEVIPAHKGRKGLRFVHLLESLDNEDEAITVTAWDTKADTEAYEKSGDYHKSIAGVKDMFTEEPVVKSYEVTASSEPLILRIF